MSVVRSFPCRLLGLVKFPARVRCDLRSTIARELQLGQGLDDNAWKFRALAEGMGALDGMARLGTMHERLWHVLRTAARLWVCETEEVEGFNSMIEMT
eukprot:2000801-Alexandrium_andersonii.AAC.1